ncbi:hypothetical protein BDW59DRAFT_162483 [Aspergillus cavernicola]|uniref:GPI-anchored cell wall organization protein Ecm33 n=1 Tax=Aspergillus cavernicola TaxID=176166 RepID=A0ABR4I9E4_9EURO
MMKYVNLLTIALGVLNLPLGTSAECSTSDPDPETGGTVLYLTSPDQLDALQDCTSITGHIVIESDYTGDFILNSVTEFLGNISGTGEGLASIELSELVELGSINVTSIGGDVSLPNLESAVDVVLKREVDAGGEVDLGSLGEVNNIRVTGSWTSINVDALKNVNQDAQFCGRPECDIMTEYDTGAVSIIVNLPELERTNRLEVAGMVESVSVPKLEIAGFQEPEVQSVQGLRINIQEGGPTLDFDAPKLHTLAGSLEVYGGVSGLSLGALGKADVGITLNARAPLDVYSTIQTSRHFYFWGELHSVYLPDLVDPGSIDLSYEPRLDCNETLVKLWKLIPSYSSDEHRCTDADLPDEEEEEDDDDDEDTVPRDEQTVDDQDTSNDQQSNTEDSTNNDDTSSAADSTNSDDSEHTGGNGAYSNLPSVGGVALMMVAIVSICFY